MNIEPNTTTDWNRLYGGSWKGTIEEDAFAHPAKFSRGLIRHIIEHAMEEGWLKPGDTVIDPFGGVALGALYATMERLNWVGMELEERFVLMGNRNIQRWENLYRAGGYKHGSAYLYHGDSRYLSLLLGRRANGCVSSPPYSGSEAIGLDRDRVRETGSPKDHGAAGPDYVLPRTVGQLAAMKEGDFEACVSSPPYAGGCAHTGGDDPHPEHIQGGAYRGVGIQGAISSPPYSECLKGGEGPGARYDFVTHSAENAVRQTSDADYGRETAGQLGAMKEGQFQAAVSSPPYAGSAQSTDGDFVLQSTDVNPTERKLDTRVYFPAEMETTGQLGAMPEGRFQAAVSSPPYSGACSYQQAGSGGEGNELMRQGLSVQEIADMRKAKDPRVLATRQEAGYSRDMKNLGNAKPDTFWAASRQVIEQVYQVLTPGARAIWVCKDFVRKGERVPFTHRWAELCVACGFEWLHEHRAWLVEDYGTQLGFFEDKPIIKKRFSFFRRLHAKKYPHLAIEWESVLCFRKP